MRTVGIKAGVDNVSIVSAASALLDEQPQRELSMTELAERIGIRTPTLYHHVGGLAQLRHAVRLATLDALSAQLRRAVDDATAKGKLAALMRAYRRFATEHAGTYPLTVRAPERDDPAQVALDTAILDTVRDALAPYHLPAGTFVTTARGLRSFVHGFVSLEAAGGFGLPDDIDASFECLVSSVAVQLSKLAEGRRPRRSLDLA